MENWRAWIEESSAFFATALEEGAFGVSYAELMLAFGIFAAALLLRGVVAFWIKMVCRRALRRTSAPKALDAIAAPVKFAVLVIGVDLSLRVLPLAAEAQAIADTAVRSLIAAAIFWSLFRIAGSSRDFMAPLARMLTPAAVDWLVKTLQIIFAVVGAAAVLEIWGVQVAPLLAGLGIFGVAIALGAQDLFKNLIAGLAVLAEKRFKAGDWILVDGVVEGTVEQINFRSTLVRRFDQGPVFVPNAMLSDNAVTNFTRMTYRRISWTIGLEYSTTGDQLRTIRDRIEHYLMANDQFVQPPEASLFVRIDAFNDSSIDIMIYCFTRTTVWGEWLIEKEKFALAIKDIVESEGAAFAFPSRTLYIARDEDGDPAPENRRSDTNGRERGVVTQLKPS